jgi:hypothetical protein
MATSVTKANSRKTDHDTTARARIRAYLAVHGPVEDSIASAASLITGAIRYKGSAVAFMQLLTAMERANEIRLEISGQRAYRISSTASGNAVAHRSQSSAFLELAVSAAEPEQGSDVACDELARALLREVVSVLQASEGRGHLEGGRRENALLAAERQAYGRRLQICRQQLLALVTDPLADVAAVTGKGGCGLHAEP